MALLINSSNLFFNFILCNWYYRSTTMLVGFSILISCNQYFGDPIQCDLVSKYSINWKYKKLKHPNLWYMNYIHNILLFYSQVTVWMKKFWNSIVGCIVRLTYLQILKAIALDKDKVIILCTTATTNGYLFFWSSRQYYFTYPESSGWCLKEVSNVHRSSVFHYFISYKSQCLSSIDWYNVLYSQVWWSFWGKEQLEG